MSNATLNQIADRITSILSEGFGEGRPTLNCIARIWGTELLKNFDTICELEDKHLPANEIYKNHIKNVLLGLIETRLLSFIGNNGLTVDEGVVAVDKATCEMLGSKLLKFFVTDVVSDITRYSSEARKFLEISPSGIELILHEILSTDEDSLEVVSQRITEWAEKIEKYCAFEQSRETIVTHIFAFRRLITFAIYIRLDNLLDFDSGDVHSRRGDFYKAMYSSLAVEMFLSKYVHLNETPVVVRKILSGNDFNYLNDGSKIDPKIHTQQVADALKCIFSFLKSANKKFAHYQ